MDEPKWLRDVATLWGEDTTDIRQAGHKVDILVAYIRELRAALGEAQKLADDNPSNDGPHEDCPVCDAWLARQRVLEREEPPILGEKGR